jgi:hypothetical protein
MQKASELKTGNQIFILEGPSTQGKTVCAATASQFSPDELPAKEYTFLKDTVFLQIDSGGVTSLKGLNLDAYVYDLSLYTNFKELLPAWNAAIKEITEGVKAGDIKFVVLDTITALDKIVVNEMRKVYDQGDNRIWNAILAKHMDFAFALKSLPCTIIVNCHTKFAGNFMSDKPETPEQQAKKRANSMPGRFDISLALTPSAADYWKTQKNGMFAVYAIQEGKSFRRVILTQPTRGFEVGHRFTGLNEEEPAHLRKLLQKAGAYRA